MWVFAASWTGLPASTLPAVLILAGFPEAGESNAFWDTQPHHSPGWTGREDHSHCDPSMCLDFPSGSGVQDNQLKAWASLNGGP